jgi:methyl-accepting chemotaxis protein
MRIGNRLILHTVLISFSAVVLTSVLVGWSAYYLGKKAIEQKALEQLIALRETKKEEIEHYFSTMQNQIITFSKSLTILNAMEDFSYSYKTYKEEAKAFKKDKFSLREVQTFLNTFVMQYEKENGKEQGVNKENLLNFSKDSSFLLQYNYIVENPNPLGEKYLLDAVDDGTKYSEFHRKYHPIIREYQEKFGYYDIFLIDVNTSEVVYTVYKELDFASSLKAGISATSGLATVFKKALAAEEPGRIFMVDFAPYLASYNEEAAFIATPIYKNNVKIGVLVFQFPTEVINNIMTYGQRWRTVGLGKTGESYLVGSDYTLRSASRFFIESPEEYLIRMEEIGMSETTINLLRDRRSTIGLQPVLTAGTLTVFEDQKAGVGQYQDYRNVRVLSAFTPLAIADLNWALMSKIDVAEVYEAVVNLAEKIAIMTLFIALVGVGISIILGKKLNNSISRPITKLSKSIKMITKNMDLTKMIPVTSKDEIGETAFALNHLIATFRDTLQETMASTEKMQLAREKLHSLSHKTDVANEENVKKIASTEKDLQDLSLKLRNLSGQFKILEEKAEKEEDW